jgi:hypothetical protein
MKNVKLRNRFRLRPSGTTADKTEEKEFSENENLFDGIFDSSYCNVIWEIPVEY